MIQALEKTVIHYSHMRDYGLNQWDAGNKSEPNPEKMLKDIGEHWHGESCPLCQKYFCADCPLYKNSYWCRNDNSPWQKVSNSENWLKFSENCESMIDILNNLIEKENSKNDPST